MRVYATYINAGLRGSRFIGNCEVSTEEGTVRLTGHRMPLGLVWVRSICHVLFVPWVLFTLPAIAITVTRLDGWWYIAAIDVCLFLVIAVGLGGVDIWTTYRGPQETVNWHPEEASPLKHTFDQTASVGPILPSLAYRFAKGQCVTKLRVPIGPNEKLKLLALRTEPHELDVLALGLSGVEGYQGVVDAARPPQNVALVGGHLSGKPDRFCRKCGAAADGGSICGKCGSAMLRYGSAKDLEARPARA